MPGEKHAILVFPAYNEARTLERTYQNIPAGVVDRVIRVFHGASSVAVVAAYLLDRANLRRNARFRGTLTEVVSPYHLKLIRRAKGTSSTSARYD